MQLKPVVGVLFNLITRTMSKTTFTLKRKLFTTFNGVSADNRVANPLPTATTSAFNQLPENFNKIGKQTQINTSMNAAKETMKNNSVVTLNSTKPNFSTRFKQAGGWGKVGKIGLGVGAGAAALGALGVFGAKKAISKAGEQSDGSKMFSQVKKNDMATIYTLKRKTYSEEDGNKSGMSTGKKIALGVGATAATAGLAFAGARRGMLGTGAMKSTNAMWAKAGNKIGAQGMVKSGSRGVGVAMAKEKGLDLGTMGGKKYAIKKSNQFQNTMLTSPKPSAS